MIITEPALFSRLFHDAMQNQHSSQILAFLANRLVLLVIRARGTTISGTVLSATSGSGTDVWYRTDTGCYSYWKQGYDIG